MAIDCGTYAADGFYDELFSATGKPRKAAQPLCSYLNKLSDEDLQERRSSVDLAIMTMGITFTVYTEGNNIDRAWPFDVIPRIIPRKEW
jgi:uncharacterized circularly permuted ATP-grasp superfamily protein